MKRLTTKEFIIKANEIHGEIYDYSSVIYKNTRTKVKIICKKHGEFKQSPTAHLNQKQGCPICSGQVLYTTDVFIRKANKVHDKKYNYSLVKYINNKSIIKIICPIHGEFLQRPDSHLRGIGCKKCDWDNKRLNKKDFIKRSKKIHDDYYDYSLVEYIQIHQKVKIKCPEHGIFNQEPNSHLRGVGCPKCNEIKSEKLISEILTNNNVVFFKEKQFEGCNNRNLPFDFYLPGYGVCIEFDGEQHHKPIEFFGGEKYFKEIQKKDKIKNNFCKDNKIDLFRISYKDNIEEKLDYFFNIYL